MTQRMMYITVGLPASGKTTWAMEQVAKDSSLVNVNRDDIREMRFGGFTGKPEHESEVTRTQNGAIANAFKREQSVIVSDTNMNRRFVGQLVKIAENWGALVEFVYFDTPMQECIKRDKARAAQGKRAVGEEVIRNFNSRYVTKGMVPRFDFTTAAHQAEPYVADESKPDAIIVDLDGTVAIHQRSPHDYDSLWNDLPNKPVIDCVLAEYQRGTHILFTSGRPDSHYDMTAEWIAKHMGLNVNGDSSVRLLMRKAPDKRMDAIIKQEIFDAEIRNNYNVKYCFDDRNQVVDAWRKIGLTVYQVADGDF